VIRFGPQACGTLEEAANREWLVTDGVGGYAMGTVAGLRTRRYHGLLVVAVGAPANRMLGLAALDPVLVVGDARYRLATDEWAGGTVDPRGYELLTSFDLTDGVPRWRWQVGGILIERELAMPHGAPAIGVVHRLLAADGPVRLERRLRLRRRLPRRGQGLGGGRRVVPRRPRARGGGARPQRH